MTSVAILRLEEQVRWHEEQIARLAGPVLPDGGVTEAVAMTARLKRELVELNAAIAVLRAHRPAAAAVHVSGGL